MKCKSGKSIHVRKSTMAEPRQQKIYNALGLSRIPGKTVKYDKISSAINKRVPMASI
jgi:hypothetical protein